MNDKNAQTKCMQGFVADILKSFDIIQAHGQEAKSCVSSLGNLTDQNSPLSCPAWFNEKFERYDKGDALGQISSPNKICLVKDRQNLFNTNKVLSNAEELDNFLHFSSDYTLAGINPGYISSCINKIDSYGNPIPEQNRKAIVAEYYYRMKRLNNYALLQVNQLAATEELISPTKKIAQKDCVISHLPEVSRRCNELTNKCGGQNSFENYSDEVYTAASLLRKIEKDLRGKTENSSERKTLEFQKEVIKQTYPILSSSKLSALVKARRGFSKSALQGRLKKQLEINRDVLKSEIEESRKFASCLNTSYQLPHCRDIDNFYKKIPKLPLSFPSNHHSQDYEQQKAALISLEDARCLTVQARDISEANQIVGDAVLGTATAVATLGIGTAIGAVGTAATLAARTRAVGSVAARLGVASTDVYWASQSSNDIANACSSVISKTSSGPIDSCPSISSSGSADVNAKICTMSLALGTLDFLPFLPAALAAPLRRAITNKQPGELYASADTTRPFGSLGGRSEGSTVDADPEFQLYLSGHLKEGPLNAFNNDKNTARRDRYAQALSENNARAGVGNNEGLVFFGDYHPGDPILESARNIQREFADAGQDVIVIAAHGDPKTGIHIYDQNGDPVGNLTDTEWGGIELISILRRMGIDLHNNPKPVVFASCHGGLAQGLSLAGVPGVGCHRNSALHLASQTAHFDPNAGGRTGHLPDNAPVSGHFGVDRNGELSEGAHLHQPGGNVVVNGNIRDSQVQQVRPGQQYASADGSFDMSWARTASARNVNANSASRAAYEQVYEAQDQLYQNLKKKMSLDQQVRFSEIIREQIGNTDHYIRTLSPDKLKSDFNKGHVEGDIYFVDQGAGARVGHNNGSVYLVCKHPKCSDHFRRADNPGGVQVTENIPIEYFEIVVPDYNAAYQQMLQEMN